MLTGKVLPNPPVRGPYGYAYIPLKEGAKPFRAKPFKLHGEKERAYLKITQDWLANGYLEPPEAYGEWLSQGFPVEKAASSADQWRGVADMRGVNAETKRINFPLPKIEDILVKQGANHIFSIIDLKQAFHQQPLHPDSRPITCTYTPLGIFQWKVNIMGLMNSSQQFQQMMEDRLKSVSDFTTPFIDDILIGTKAEEGEDLYEKHYQQVCQVMDILEKDKLVGDVRKAHFFIPEVKFCGHILGGGTRRPEPGKLMAIEKWELPRTISELRAFLGFTNYYSMYVEMYAEVVAILQDKLKVPRELGKKGSRHKLQFSEEEIQAFEEIKKRLCSKLILQRVNPDRPFVLRVDASRYAVGGHWNN